MSAKFKPKKKEVEACVDEWDASGGSDEEAEVQKKLSGIRITAGDLETREADKAKQVQGVWGSDINGATARREVKSGRSLWEEANSSAPLAQPVIEGNRSLPTTLLAPRISASSSASESTLQRSTPFGEYDSRPPPQILRRDRAAEEARRAGARQDASAKQKSIAEREEEYRLARERIFGKLSSGTDASSTGDGGSRRKLKTTSSSSNANSRNGSGSDTGGRNSPNSNTKSLQTSTARRR